MTVTGILVALIAAVFAVAALLAIVRMVKGPSILDRALASDVLLTMVLCVLGAEAAINKRTDTLPAMLMIAATGVLGTVAVARFVARRDRSDGTEARGPRDRQEDEDREGAEAGHAPPDAGGSGQGGGTR